ncbi:MAG: apolipoprotein N-acyltransferase [Pseudomonadota bacterium]|jgi:apolipoprotein N-acyltransferase|nr:apolipoprotein N-acyltransferase [Pseudomonadota bacterium]
MNKVDQFRPGRMTSGLIGGSLHALSLSPWVADVAAGAPMMLQTLALLILLVGLQQQATSRGAAVLCWLYGTCWLVGATGWMFVSLHRYGGLPAWMAVVAVGMLCAALSLYLAVAGWVWARWRTGVIWCDAGLFGAVWLLAELARALLFTGFPWGASGYGLLDTPAQHLAPWLGVYGMGWAWATLCAWGCWSMLGAGVGQQPSRGARFAPVLGLLALLAVGGMWVGSSHTQVVGSRLQVTLLQGNVPQDEKFTPSRQIEMLVWHGRELVAAPGDLVLAPETAIPLLPSQLPDGYWAELQAAFKQEGRHALIGVPLGDFQTGYTNSVAGLSADVGTRPDQMYRYDKHHLVPFGEFIPFGFRWFVQMMNIPLGDFSRGVLAAPSFSVKGQRVAPTICYEDLFGEEIAARFVDVTQAPTILANVSNLAWFGDSVAIHQHLQIARLRSLEFQLPTLRATNTGATVVINHKGEVTAGLAPNTRGSLHAEVQGMSGVTPYAWWVGRWGLWPLIVLGVLWVCATAIWGRRSVRDTGI